MGASYEVRLESTHQSLVRCHGTLIAARPVQVQQAFHRSVEYLCLNVIDQEELYRAIGVQRESDDSTLYMGSYRVDSVIYNGDSDLLFAQTDTIL